MTFCASCRVLRTPRKGCAKRQALATSDIVALISGHGGPKL